MNENKLCPFEVCLNQTTIAALGKKHPELGPEAHAGTLEQAIQPSSLLCEDCMDPWTWKSQKKPIPKFQRQSTKEWGTICVTVLLRWSSFNSQWSFASEPKYPMSQSEHLNHLGAFCWMGGLHDGSIRPMVPHCHVLVTKVGSSKGNSDKISLVAHFCAHFELKSVQLYEAKPWPSSFSFPVILTWGSHY